MKFILVVDDELDILETIVDSLEIEFDSSEVKVHRAENGVQAIKRFEAMIGNDFYDLVITDLNMPQMDGIELTKHLKERNGSTPVIVFTGHGDAEEQEQLTQLGVVAMIKKPYVEDLIDEVVSVLN